jgi:hypothetical protein
MNVNFNISKRLVLIVAAVLVLLIIVAGTSLAVTTAQNDHNLAVQRAAAAAVHRRAVAAHNSAVVAAKAKATALAIANADTKASRAEKSARAAKRAARQAANRPPVVVAPAAPAAPAAPIVTDPWAVVSAYYGDVESGDYASAYALLSSGMATGQSYSAFVAGYACTGSETVTENWESGDQVNFSLAASNDCSGATQYFTGTDTVQNGMIVAGDVVQTG